MHTGRNHRDKSVMSYSYGPKQCPRGPPWKTKLPVQIGRPGRTNPIGRKNIKSPARPAEAGAPSSWSAPPAQHQRCESNGAVLPQTWLHPIRKRKYVRVLSDLWFRMWTLSSCKSLWATINQNQWIWLIVSTNPNPLVLIDKSQNQWIFVNNQPWTQQRERDPVSYPMWFP